ncbi:lipoprotein, putative [Nitratidesulfovibrio vulgaris DP4]|uniref:Lipoprotein, putative n=2 Tax=Nitratidesulfovibrio vulgaris TaxID=881 RepID=A0A0H3ABM0_NITV4|nr:lipoprotein, putative [Nitratidesulfovibrio vulgaris DP4]
MQRIGRKLQCGIIFIVLACSLVCIHGSGIDAYADDGRHDRHEGRHASSVVPEMPDIYVETCGGCHMAYPAMLLPHEGWASIVGSAGAHFGTEVVMSPAQQQAVTAYLSDNAADRSGTKLGRKIARSVSGVNVSRITEVPYIQHKHRDIGAAVLTRESVGGLANCIACHPGATGGQFDDDDVAIPTD